MEKVGLSVSILQDIVDFCMFAASIYGVVKVHIFILNYAFFRLWLILRKLAAFILFNKNSGIILSNKSY